MTQPPDLPATLAELSTARLADLSPSKVAQIVARVVRPKDERRVDVAAFSSSIDDPPPPRYP